MMELLKLMVRDCLDVMADETKHPETRAFAQIMGRNITGYDPSLVSVEEFRALRLKMRVGGE